MPAIPHLFSLSGLVTGAMLPCFGAAVSLFRFLAAGVRSLKIEHVSSEVLVPQEICRHLPSGQILPASIRRWFWTRKPDAGFLRAGVPATLLDARVWDSWLEAMVETLAGGLWPAPVVFAVSAPAATR